MVHHVETLPPRELGRANLTQYIREHAIAAELIAPGMPMGTVTQAAQAIGVAEEQILKSLLFWDKTTGKSLLAIACGNDKINDKINLLLLAAVSQLPRPRLASAAHVLAITGYRPGGVPPIGHAAPLAVIVDRQVTALETAYGGGGSEDFLPRVKTQDFLRLTGATVATIVPPYGNIAPTS